MKVYCDTSFFFAAMVPGEAREIARQSAIRIKSELGFVPVSSLGRFEFLQAIRWEAWLNKGDRSKGMNAVQAETLINLFLAEMGDSFHLVSPAWETVFAQAELMTRGTAKSGTRSLDILHVASATALGASEFYSFDVSQNELAKGQGLKVPLASHAA